MAYRLKYRSGMHPVLFVISLLMTSVTFANEGARSIPVSIDGICADKQTALRNSVLNSAAEDAPDCLQSLSAAYRRCAEASRTEEGSAASYGNLAVDLEAKGRLCEDSARAVDSCESSPEAQDTHQKYIEAAQNLKACLADSGTKFRQIASETQTAAQKFGLFQKQKMFKCSFTQTLNGRAIPVSYTWPETYAGSGVKQMLSYGNVQSHGCVPVP